MIYNVLTTLTGLQVTDTRNIIDQGFLGNDTKTANCKINTFEVHSISSGTVISIDRDDKYAYWHVTVEVNSKRWVRYCCLASFKVKVGEVINKGDFIGYGYRGTMRFEYCTDSLSQFPVRLVSRTMYKQDPTPILFEQEDVEEVF